MSRKKIFLFIKNQEYFRNYILSDFDLGLREHYDIKYIIERSIFDLFVKSRPDALYTVYERSNSAERSYIRLSEVNSWRNRSKSKSFRYRIFRNLQFRGTLSEIKSLDDIYNIFRNRISVYRRIIEFKLLEWNVFYKFYSWHKTRGIKLPHQVVQQLQLSEKFSCIFPSSAYDYELDALLRGRELWHHGRIILIADNWDNLSSKTVLSSSPDHVFVWGEQSAEHASKIQNIDSERVSAIGTARYFQYYGRRDALRSSPFEFEYILFVGTALEFDEYTPLKLLNDFIVEKDLADLNVVYRPHPQRQATKSVDISLLERVVLDPQISQNTQMPDLDYYPELIGHSLFVSGGLTSMLIEASIMKKYYLAVVFDEPENYTSQRSALHGYTHFEGIDKLNSVILCKDQSEFTRSIERLVENSKIPPISDYEAEYFCSDSTYTLYLNRIFEKLDCIDNV